MSSEPKVMVVEDDAALRELLREELTEAGYTVEPRANAESALTRILEGGIDLVICDLRLPGMDAMALLASVREESNRPGFVVITAFGTIDQAVVALKGGADDFLTKPLDFDHLRITAARVLEHHRLRRTVERLAAEFTGDDFHGLLGRSAAMRRMTESVRRIAAGDLPVLIAGESGTGKELVARAVHAESGRAAGPFTAVNCAGVPPDLLESEFFGHVRGAFSGAERQRNGLFQTASGGTLFLDEIGEMPVNLQAKLLRVLEDGRIRPVGADREEPVNVRIVAATHRDLERAVDAGTFRADLFYRLEGLRIEVPPLREREDDIELLTGYFLRRICHRQERKLPTLADDFLGRLRRYPFPGNIRELLNAVERAVTFATNDELAAEHLPERMRRGHNGAGLPDTLTAEGDLPTLEELERRYVAHVLRRLDGNKRQAAAVLGIGRRTLYRRLEGEE